MTSRYAVRMTMSTSVFCNYIEQYKYLRFVSVKVINLIYQIKQFHQLTANKKLLGHNLVRYKIYLIDINALTQVNLFPLFIFIKEQSKNKYIRIIKSICYFYRIYS